MIEIINDYIPKSKKRDGTIIKPQFLTIHSTGNPKSTARNERNYLTNPANISSTSFHIVVDEKEAIICVPLNERAWHAGDGIKGLGNNKSIGLEICESGDREKTLRNAAYVAAYIIEHTGLTLMQHWDWTGKNCPRILRDTGRWDEFKQMVQTELDKMKPPLTNRDKAIEIIKQCCDSPDIWIKRLDEIEYFAEFVLKINGGGK